MKTYKPCEVNVHNFVTEDVIKTSQPQADGVTRDNFTDDNWYEQGGQGA